MDTETFNQQQASHSVDYNISSEKGPVDNDRTLFERSNSKSDFSKTGADFKPWKTHQLQS